MTTDLITAAKALLDFLGKIGVHSVVGYGDEWRKRVADLRAAVASQEANGDRIATLESELAKARAESARLRQAITAIRDGVLHAQATHVQFTSRAIHETLTEVLGPMRAVPKGGQVTTDQPADAPASDALKDGRSA